MRTRMGIGIISLLAVQTICAAAEPIKSNPIPEAVAKRGIAVEVVELARLPDTRGIRPADQDVRPAGWARINFVRDLPDGRRFANDSRGLLYFLDSKGQSQVYANLAETFPLGVYNRLSAGFVSFVFHPEFAQNGLFYTTHTEHAPGNPATPNFIPPGYGLKDVTYHNVLTEWRATNPAANAFAGTRRELLRTAHVVANLIHPLGALEFNPTARPGSEDYGLLYTSGSDHGFSNGAGPNASNPAQTQRLDSIITAMLRIDPRSPSVTGGRKGLGDYTIPMANKLAALGSPVLGEIYAYGFRNAHRLSWDTDGTMFANDIGMNHIEEINIVRNGGNYGWMAREGYWENGRWRGGALDELYPLPEEILDGRVKDGFTYPVAIYDHDEGRAITAGFAYHGRIDALRGKYVFGDIFAGRIFVADLAAMKKADDGIPRTVAPIEEVQLYERDSGGKRVNVSMQELIDRKMGAKIPRADLFISQTRDGELLITSRQDGTIRMLIPDSRAEN
ncbi:MAG: PQQ-dependent sugar dehydrogenase [Xanthobacteraceae bacterium]